MSKSYNQELKPLDPALNNERIMVLLTYQEVQAIGNVLWDLHREADRSVTPQSACFESYPLKELESMHEKIYRTMSNISLSMEQKWKEKE